MFDAYFAWLRTLPLWSQPIVETAIPCFAVLLVLMIWQRIIMRRKGIRPTKHKTSVGEWAFCGAVVSAAFYARQHYPAAARVLDWPNRFPMWRAHGGAMMIGFFAAAYAAMAVSAVFAALFLRSGRRAAISSRTDDPFRLPALPGYVVRSWGSRTRTLYEEDEP